MKPKDLKSPFIWEERRVIIEDRIWYVPEQFEDFSSFAFPGWDHTNIFPIMQPISLEYCSGNGGWIADKARVQNDLNWVAIERKFKRVKKIWSKIKNYNLSNVLAVCGEGFLITKHYIPCKTVQNVYINFPDPWPKQRHAKNRIVQLAFIEEIYRILRPRGTLTLVTDDEHYSEEMIATISHVSGFISTLGPPYYTTDYPDYGASYFEDLWRQKGKTIRYHLYQKL